MRNAIHGLIIRLTSGGLVLGALVIGPARAGAEPANPPARPVIVVRSYTQAAAARDVLAGRGVAGAILSRAGIDVVWLECSGSADSAATAAACDRPLEWNEVVLRVVAGGTVERPTGRAPLGFAHVDVQAGAGLLATIYADRVTALAFGARVEAADVIARAIAHEIGHLLLGTNRHARRGLMRAAWSAADLQRNLPLEWMFSKAEAAAMRRGLAARTPSA